VVTAERRASADAADASTRVSEVVVSAAKARAAPTSADPAARLRAAAAAGRVSEIKTLLVQGAPVDAADAAGRTALMAAVQARQPAAAALLLRHGADLDLTDQAGESARQMAAAIADPALDKALGLAP